MSDYAKLKKPRSVADSLMEAVKASKAHSPVGNKDQGDYYKIKQPNPLADRLDERFKKLKAKVSKKK